MIIISRKEHCLDTPLNPVTETAKTKRNADQNYLHGEYRACEPEEEAAIEIRPTCFQIPFLS